uniref:Coagulation factor V n=1 Tax=Sander lucioperca TaxID=283035 RepID=A0A8D0CYV1_SANLU
NMSTLKNNDKNQTLCISLCLLILSPFSFLSSSAGLLGPTLRAQEGETIVVTFRNLATEPYSIHPHGIAYGKQSEGANYFDNTSQKEKEDDIVRPNRQHVYSWEVTKEVSPQPSDPTCLTYTYISHTNVVEDYNSGLIGALLICKPGSLDESGKQVGFYQEYVFLFGVFDENESKRSPNVQQNNSKIKHTQVANGFSLLCPDVSVCAYASVSLHLVGMSSEPDVFSVHMNGQVLQQSGHKVSSVGLISGSSATASMVALHTGHWLLSSHTIKHMEGMWFCTRATPQRRMTIEQKRYSTTWTYYIAAEEIVWDYAPNMPKHIDDSVHYLRRSPTRIGGKYKKAVYSLFRNESFTERLEPKQRKNELGILGPVIKAQIRDVIKIVFKNMASRPYSIYPHGLTIENNTWSHGVQPGETHTYIWRVVEEDEPLDGDSRCLTRLYHSAVDTVRDIASGLIGQILICKYRSLNIRGVQLKADKEQHAMLAVFDENKSWYLDENIRQYCDRSKVNKADLDFYKSNVMHSINGYVFESGPLLGFCNGEIATWHVSSIGAQDYIQTATFYGHTFEVNGRTEDFLSLYPMTGETITMNMDNIGVWLMASLNSHGTTKAMRVKFQDVECYRDNLYEYSDVSMDFNEWNPLSSAEIKKDEEKPKPVKPVTSAEPDSYTDMFADELGLRSLKNPSRASSVEQLDLSFLDYDAVDVPEGDTNITPNFKETKNRSETSIPKPNTLNEISNWEEVDELNLTAVNLLNQSMKRSNLTILDLEVKGTDNTTSDNDSLITTAEPSIPMADVVEVSINSTERSNLIIFEMEVESDNDSLVTAADPEYGLQMNSTESVPISANSSLDDVTHVLLKTGPLHNVTENTLRSNLSEEISSEIWENVTAFPGELNHTSPAERLSNETELYLTSETLRKNNSEELSALDSIEEVLIYLTENKTHVIKTTNVKTQGHNWTYEGTHQMESVEILDYMMKYIGKETPKTTPTPKKIKKVHLRQRPQKGQGMKTKRRKEYKPQAKSGLPFSPRGFNPGITPRGARPLSSQTVSDEEELINEPVVIGVPRPDFSDYELYVPGDDPDHLGLEENVKADEYEYVSHIDPYQNDVDIKNLNLDDTAKYYLKLSGPNVKTYFLAAEEVEWDYAGYGQRRPEESQPNSRETKFTKVVFRGYMDSSFSTPDFRGELDEHLGILGPVIKAEVGQSIMVVFRNKANRPYSLHPNGVSYTKQTEGLSYEDGSKYWYKYDNEVQPNTTFTYLWKVNSMVGPMPDESHCRTWAYYSGVNPERDIHSGLIGPLLVCREGTLDKTLNDMREFTLLFMTFDESQSWYYKENQEMMQRKSRRRLMDTNPNDKFKFHSINGITYNLKGLRMYTKQLVCWYLINMGSPKDFQSVHFHGQTFLHKKTTSYRQAVYPLLPGSFATLEMYPSKPGLWQLETEVSFNQEKGMQTLFLVLDNECYRPLGLESGSVNDNQITAINTRGSWKPHLARLNNLGKFNAWSTEQNKSWIQVDFQRPVVISQVATQGARQMLYSQYVVKYAISYSTDRQKWIFYKGDKVCYHHLSASPEKKNIFFPPVVGRFIRLHPIDWYSKATVRMEFYGCELDGCSVPLGMESRLIEDHQITASSTATSWYSGPWRPSLARLNTQGTINAWQAKHENMNQWLQVELPKIKKITGIMTQGAKSLGKEMYVMSYALQYSTNGINWNQYTDDESIPSKTFLGNTNNNDHVKNYIYPPIFSRFIRIIPISWMNSITMRIELLGCDFE